LKDNAVWKQLYHEARQDCKRTRITLEELCSIKWKFKFLDLSGYHYHQDPVFYEDHTITMGSRTMKWRFVERTWDDMEDDCEDDCEPKKVSPTQLCVQVEQYPLLTVVRTEDWGWQMTNSYVQFTSSASTLQSNPSDNQAHGPNSNSHTNSRPYRWWFLFPLHFLTQASDDTTLQIITDSDSNSDLDNDLSDRDNDNNDDTVQD